ncbi:MAG: hypothetical protein PVF65_09370, partial [Sphingomonadales bacterium]
MASEVKVPQLGESITEATVGKWLKSVGDSVAQDEPIAELETDKVAMEVNAPVGGTLSEIVAKEGETVEIGALLAMIDESGKAAAPTSAPKTEEAPKAASSETVDITVPQLGESITEAVIGKWLKNAGDAVALDEPVAELETDKVAMEVPAPAAGTLAEQIAKEGDTVEIGALIGKIAAGEAAAAPAPAQKAEAPAPALTAEPQDNMPMAPAAR